MKKFALVAALALALEGCAYAVSRPVAEQADRALSFEKLLSDPDAFKGKLVILGGTIVRTTQVKQDTVIEVVQKDLDYWGKPKRTVKTGGRFLILMSGFLSPSVYAPGREVTVAGEVLGTDQKLGETERAYPLLKSREIRLWPREQPSERPSWWDPLYDPHGAGRPGW